MPRYLYKYRTVESALRFLQRSELYFAAIDEFNDPFECDYKLVGKHTQKEIALDIYDKTCSQAQGLMGMLVPKENEYQSILKNIIDGILRQIGVCCFTTKPDNLLMWAHYADEHKGVCLEFDLLADLEAFMLPHQVNYSTGYPYIDYLDIERDVSRLIYQKSTDWMYEDEYRVLKPDTHGPVAIRPQALTKIIFGCRTIQPDIDKIKQAVASHPDYHVAYRRAGKDPYHYKLYILHEDSPLLPQ